MKNVLIKFIKVPQIILGFSFKLVFIISSYSSKIISRLVDSSKITQEHDAFLRFPIPNAVAIFWFTTSSSLFAVFLQVF